jgi:hypothetical protein
MWEGNRVLIRQYKILNVTQIQFANTGWGWGDLRKAPPTIIYGFTDQPRHAITAGMSRSDSHPSKDNWA